MKLKYTIAALAATTLASSAATLLSQGVGGANGNYSFQSFAVNDAGFTASGDALTGVYDLDTITFTKGDNDTDSTTTFINVYDGATGTYLGSSTNSFDWSATGVGQGETATFDFTGVAGVDGLLDGTIYAFEFSATAADAGAPVSIRLEVGTLGSANPVNPADESPLSTGNLSSTINYDALVTVGITTVVPEPSSSALLGLGGLALILRRRK